MAFANCRALPLRSRLRLGADVGRCTRARRLPVRASASAVTSVATERMLHVVYRVGDMGSTGQFLKSCGMHLLRERDVPEEKYANAFYGYGTESRGEHFAVELTYNYGVDWYEIGDALDYFCVAVPDPDNVRGKLYDSGFQVTQASAVDPTGYKFKIVQGSRKDPMAAIGFNVADIDASVRFYENIGMQVISTEGTSSATVGYGDEESTTVLHLSQYTGANSMTMGDGYGQIAVSTPSVYELADRMRINGVKITRDPGPVPGIGTKITAVRDPDGFKVVFVDESDFEAELV